MDFVHREYFNGGDGSAIIFVEIAGRGSDDLTAIALED
jgi:hypothetical protein